jgi:hypothetical protein
MGNAALRSTSPREPEHREGLPRPAPLPALAPSTGEPFLGPAVVTRVDGDRVTVSIEPGSQVEVVLAFALPYSPEEADVLLVIGKRDAFYAIGVISGRGRTALALQGDVSLHAVGGTLELSGDQGLKLHAPAIDVQTDTLNTVARSVVGMCSTLFQRVTEMLRVHAGESHAVVEGGSFSQSKTASIQTEETVTINGKEIHLG